MSEFLKREAVFFVTGLVTVIMFIEFFFFPADWSIAEMLRLWGIIVYNMSLGLGAVFMMRNHSKNVIRKGSNWQFSGWLIISMAVMLLTGLIGYAFGGAPADNSIYSWVFTHIYTPLGATLYAITGFYIFSAAYRAFRARNIDSALMLIAGCFVILSNAPVGEVIWSGIPTIGTWFKFTGQIPGMRSFALVAALGMLAYGFRALLGKEKGFYAGVSSE